MQDSHLLNPVNYNSLALKALPENREKVKNLSLPLVEVVHRGATCQNITIQSNNQKKNLTNMILPAANGSENVEEKKTFYYLA